MNRPPINPQATDLRCRILALSPPQLNRLAQALYAGIPSDSIPNDEGLAIDLGAVYQSCCEQAGMRPVRGAPHTWLAQAMLLAWIQSPEGARQVVPLLSMVEEHTLSTPLEDGALIAILIAAMGHVLHIEVDNHQPDGKVRVLLRFGADHGGILQSWLRVVEAYLLNMQTPQATLDKRLARLDGASKATLRAELLDLLDLDQLNLLLSDTGFPKGRLRENVSVEARIGQAIDEMAKQPQRLLHPFLSAVRRDFPGSKLEAVDRFLAALAVADGSRSGNHGLS